MKKAVLALAILFCIMSYGLMLYQHSAGTDRAIQNETVETFNRGSLFD